MSSFTCRTDVTHRNFSALSIGDGDTEDAFAQENSLGMVPKIAMSEIPEEGFRLIKPIVDWHVILGLAAEFLGAAFRVLEWCELLNSGSNPWE